MTTVTGQEAPAGRSRDPATVAGWVVIVGEVAVFGLVGIVTLIAGLNAPYGETGEWQFTPTGREYLVIGVAILAGVAALGVAACLTMINQLAGGIFLLVSGLGLLVFGLVASETSAFVRTLDREVWPVAAGLAAFPGALFLIGSLGPRTEG